MRRSEGPNLLAARLARPEKTPEEKSDSFELAWLCADVCWSMRAVNVSVYDVRKLTTIADYYVLCTAASAAHARGVSEEVSRTAKKHGHKKLGVEGQKEGAWVLVDLVDVVVHVFREEARNYYDLELLWGDADQYLWKDELREDQAPPAKDDEYWDS
ncbi:MAG: ribosome silencing factor [Planctomycetes bacterium]|nr:ribosome silencing factor [Planctomycetota bacterium]